MRAPQYGHTKGKKRGSQTAMPPKARLWHAVGLRGPNEPLPTSTIRYKAPRVALYEDGTYGAPCTLSLHHKGAKWDNGVKVGGEGPTVTKKYTVEKTRDSGRVGP